MAWIPLYLDVPDHPKTKRLARLAKCSTSEVVGLLVKTWVFAVRFGRDGVLVGYSDEEFTTALDIDDDDSSRIVDSMVRSGWLDRTDDGHLRIHDWDDHIGRHVRSLDDRRDRDRARRSGSTETSGNIPADFQGRAPTFVVDSTTTAVDSTTTVADSTYVVGVQYNTKQDKTGQDRTGQNIQRARSRARPAASAVVVDAESARPRDELWDAFTDSLGDCYTPQEKSRRGKVVRDLRQAGITGDDLRRALANWPNVMGSATCSETGVASHIGKLLSGFQTGGRTSGVVLDRSVRETVTVSHRQTLSEAMDERRRRSAAVDRLIAGDAGTVDAVVTDVTGLPPPSDDIGW